MSLNCTGSVSIKLVMVMGICMSEGTGEQSVGSRRLRRGEGWVEEFRGNDNFERRMWAVRAVKKFEENSIF